MKRLCTLLLVLTLILSLYGCAIASPLETPPSMDASGRLDSQPDNPTETTEATQIQDPTENSSEPPEYEGVLGFIARGYQPFEMFGVRLDLSKVYMNLYYLVDLSTGEVTQVFDFPVRYVYECQIGADECVYYVTMHEPNAVYLYNRSQNTHTMCYKSDVGPITFLAAQDNDEQHVVTFVVNNQQFVRVDTKTGDQEVLMEMFFIERAYYEGQTEVFGTVYNKTIYWTGMQHKDDVLKEYFYFGEIGEVMEYPFL